MSDSDYALLLLKEVFLLAQSQEKVLRNPVVILSVGMGKQIVANADLALGL